MFRELLQNSLDAGSTRIDIEISKDEEKGGSIVRFQDDGCGMTREVLEKVYFRLGESTKDSDEDSIGGFGRARILTNFSMDSYTILTQNNEVRGSGAEYEVHDTEEYHEGCTQILRTSDAETYEFRNSCENFLNTCDIRIPVFLNGSEMQYRMDVTSDKIKDLEYEDQKFAELFYTPPSRATMRGYAVFRVNGCQMFSRYLGCEGSVVIEIVPEKSRYVLTASRSELKRGYNTFLDTLLREFITNEEEASRRDLVNEFRSYTGRGVYMAAKKGSPHRHIEKKKRASYGKNYKAREIALYANEIIDNRFSGKDLPAYCEAMSQAHVEDKASYYEASIGDFLPNVVVHTKTADKDLIRLSKLWDIKDWKFRIKGDSVDWGEHKEKISLLFVWEEACRIAIEELLEFRGFGFNWTPGFLLSERVKASHTVKANIHFLMLNPYNDHKAFKYDLRSELDLMEILACAKHEVSHIAYQDHNEQFAITLSNIDSILHQGDAIIRMKQVRIA